MHKRIAALLFVTTLIALSVSQARAEADLVANGGFETGHISPEWSGAGGNLQINNYVVHSGAYSAYLGTTDGYVSGGGTARGRIAIQPGGVYTLSAYIYSRNLGTALALIRWYPGSSGGGSGFVQSPGIVMADAWGHIEYQFTAPERASWLLLELHVKSSDPDVVRAFYFDDISLVGPEPLPATEEPITPQPTQELPTSSPTPIPATPTIGPGCLFSDVCPPDYWFVPVEWLGQHGAISGYADQTFRPFNNATRGQLAKIVVSAEGWVIDTTSGGAFSDVPADNPFYEYISTAYSHGIIAGYGDGTFRPNNPVTRGQLSKIIVLAEAWSIITPLDPTFTDVAADSPFYAFVETAVAHGIISGYDTATGKEFRPGANATRGQIAKIVYGAVTQ